MNRTATSGCVIVDDDCRATTRRGDSDKCDDRTCRRRASASCPPSSAA